MVEHVGRAMKAAGIERPIIVIGHGGELIQEALGDAYQYAWQREQQGTGHAARMAAELIANHDGPVIIAAGDTPMLQSDTFTDLIKSHNEAGAKATMATSILEDPKGYGRIVRDTNGSPERIVEDKDASAAEKLIKEINVALYCFDCQTLLGILPKIKNDNAQGEFYLTDALDLIRSEGGKLEAKIFDDPDIIVGVNDRWQLAMVGKEMGRRILRKHAVNGVTLMDIDSISIEVDVTIGADTILEPGTLLVGKTTIGSGCKIGPYTRIENSTVGNETTIVTSYVDQAEIGNKVWIGPYAHLRPHAELGDKAKIGNFVEIKKSKIAKGAKVNHLSYIGDAEVGEDTNIGAGTITCNYNGYTKSQTIIGAGAFIGSNSTLVAPLKIGDNAMITAGSVVTHDVPEHAAAFGRARQETKEDWARKWREAQKSSGH